MIAYAFTICPSDFNLSKNLYTKSYPFVITNSGNNRAHVKATENIPLL
jgi:hypothetical protein